MRIVRTCVVLAAAAGLAAAGPVGAISCSESFDLRGKSVPVSGIPSWPVLSGDVIQTLNAPATMTFSDGSLVTRAPQSKAKINSDGGRVVLTIVEGAMKYRVSDPARLSLIAIDKALAVRSGKEGSYFSNKGGKDNDGGHKRQPGEGRGDDRGNRDDKDQDGDHDRDDDHHHNPPPVSCYKRLP